jgi:hypothetical protein
VDFPRRTTPDHFALRFVAQPSATMSPPAPRETPMNAVRVETTVEADGELPLTDLPCRRGGKVEAIVLVH